MFWVLWTEAAIAGGCDPGEPTRMGLQSWLAGDHLAVRAALDEAATAFGCSPIADPQTLARYWILDGAILAAAGDREESSGSFAAARRVAPDLWLQDLGPALHQAFLSAGSPEGTGAVVVAPDPGPGRVWVDGLPSTAPDVPAGLHLVQISGADGAAVFATVVWVDPGVSVLVEPVIAEPEPVVVVPVPVEVPPTPAPEPVDRVRPELQLLTGASTAFGQAFASREDQEPGVKVAVPLELGFGVASRLGWARAQVGVAGLLGGQYLASTGDGETITRSTRIDFGFAAGVGDELRFGVAGGMQWPSRLAGRLLVGWSPISPLVAELRVGANVTTARTAEPALELLVGVRF